MNEHKWCLISARSYHYLLSMYWQRTHIAVKAIKQKKIDNSHSENQKESSNQMLAASFYTGKGFTDVKNILNFTGYVTYSKASFYGHQPDCEQWIIEKANEMTEVAREHFSGMHGTATAVDQESHQVVYSYHAYWYKLELLSKTVIYWDNLVNINNLH